MCLGLSSLLAADSTFSRLLKAKADKQRKDGDSSADSSDHRNGKKLNDIKKCKRQTRVNASKKLISKEYKKINKKYTKTPTPGQDAKVENKDIKTSTPDKDVKNINIRLPKKASRKRTHQLLRKVAGTGT